MQNAGAMVVEDESDDDSDIEITSVVHERLLVDDNVLA